MRFIGLVLCLMTLLTLPLRAADRLDTVPRVAVVSAFEPEWKTLKASVADAKSHSVNGVEAIRRAQGQREKRQQTEDKADDTHGAG